MIAFGSGGWTGLGLGDSRQKLGFVPEHHTDFIFPIIGEELGLVTTLPVVLAFVALLFCGICIARRAADTFGMLLAAGITFMISIQAIIEHGRGHQPAAQQRHAPAFHQLWRIQFIVDARQRRSFVERRPLRLRTAAGQTQSLRCLPQAGR